jgi:hypothetical protein
MMQKYKEMAFMIGFLIYLLVLYVASAKLSAGSRAFPMAIIGVSVIVVGLKLLTLQFKSLKWLDPSGNVAQGIIEKAKEGRDLSVCEGEAKEEEKEPESRLRTISLFMLWLISFAGAIYFIGFLPTMAVWLFIFMVGISRIKWTKALLLSVCTFAVLYLTFVTMFGANFPPGILF